MKIKLLLFLSCIIGIKTANAQWNNNTSINTLVSKNSRDQQNVKIVSDGLGGAFMVWEDFRVANSNSDIMAQHSTSAGLVDWPVGDIAICNSPNNQNNHTAIADGNSLIVAWTDYRNNVLGDIYIQKIDATGSITWPANGLAVNTDINSAKKEPKLCVDATHNIYVVWEDSFTINSGWNIKGQKLASNGALLWAANGIDVCNANNSQINAKVKNAISTNGIHIVWQDKRSGNNYDIFHQIIDNSGQAVLAANGLAVCTISNTQSNPEMIEGTNSDVIITWIDKRNNSNYDVYAQRINDTGTQLWASNGIAVCTALNNQSGLDMASDNLGNAIVVWKDSRAGFWNNDIYAQKINSNGSMAWTNNGLPVMTSSSNQVNPSIITHNNGAATIVWQDSTGNSWNAAAAGISSLGNINWIGYVANANNNQTNPKLCSDGIGGAIFAFQDSRDTATRFDIYCQHVDSLGNGTSVISGIQNASKKLQNTIHLAPNPFHDYLQINIAESNFKSSNYEFEMYNIFGQKIFSASNINSHSNTINFKELENGIYFYTIKNEQSLIVSNGKLIKQ